MATALTITIGRNVNTTPMGDLEWRAFRVHAFCIAVDAIAPEFKDESMTFQYEGHNSWEGVSEESYKVEVIGSLIPEYLSTTMIERLKFAAKHFHQDAIAYTLGFSNLAFPTNVPEKI